MANKAFDKDEAAEPAALTIADLIAALKASSGNDDESMKKRAQFEAEARQRLEEDENRRHPAISVYSHPEGERDHPKPPLKCEMFWVGYPLEKDNLTPEEVDLLNLATGGEYPYHKADGSPETLKVKASNGLNGRLDKLEFTFPCRGDLKHNQPPLTTMLREAFGQPDELTALKAELAKARERLIAVGGI